MEPFEAFDGLVNCAGIASLESPLELDADAFDRVMAVNARGAAMVARAVALEMIERDIAACRWRVHGALNAVGSSPASLIACSER